MDTPIGVGISCYNDVKLTGQLLESIISKTNFEGDYQIIVVDDGTKNKKILDDLAMLCHIYDADLVLNKENQGIPYTWNRIVKTLHERYKCEDIVILNNDLVVLDENWLQCLVFFLDNNDKVGTVGLGLAQVDHRTGQLEEYDPQSFGDQPAKVGCATGCDFAIKESVWEKVKNPDSSIGWFSGLKSFHEELWIGFKLAGLDYASYMLPYPAPAFAHWGGATFMKNPELTEMKLPTSGEVGIPIDKNEFIQIIKASKIYPEAWKKDRIVWQNDKGEDMVDRMSFSRYLFAKYWGVLENYEAPQIPVHERIVTPIPPRKVKWLDKDLKVQEAFV